MLVRSVFPGLNGAPAGDFGVYITDDRSPFEQRWGGWYVTGMTGSMQHMGNAILSDSTKSESLLTNQTLNLASLKGKFDTDAYVTPYSDVVALMVFEHEMHMINLFTRVGWEARLAKYQEQMNKPSKDRGNATERLYRDASNELVDYMLFVDEIPLTSTITGTSGFTSQFSTEGPFDNKGRSLRQFDLERRLMRYPCSFMIYSEAFNGLPEEVKEAIYKRLWQILSGEEKGDKYRRLSFSDRRAILEILRDTKRGLPIYFQSITR
jgi:hypothetical protein